MFGMKDLPGLCHVASYAEGVHVADQFGIFEVCFFHIGYFGVAVKAGLLKNFFFGIQLSMGIVSLVLVFIVTFKTDTNIGIVGCAPEKFLLF